MAKKSPNLNGKTVIGFDETHNGFHLNYHDRYSLPLIITGYKIDNYSGRGSQGTNTPFGRKGGAFGKKRNENEIKRRSRGFLEHNQHFYYSAINEEKSPDSAAYFRAMAITAITLRFLNGKMPLNEKELFIVIDKPNDETYSSKLENRLQEMFKFSEIFPNTFSQHVIIKEKADKKNTSCRFADSTGYHLISLYSLRKKLQKAPFRSRIVNPYDWLTLIDERLSNRERHSYFDI